MAQIVLGIVVLSLLAGGTFLFYLKRKHERPEELSYMQKDINYLLRVVKKEMVENTKGAQKSISNHYDAQKRIRRKVMKALEEAPYNVPWAVDVVVAMIRDIVVREVPTMEDANVVYPFNEPWLLDPSMKFRLLCYRLKKKVGDEVIGYLERTYHISDLSVCDIETGRLGREFNAMTLDNIFHLEVEDEPIEYSEALDILADVLFSKYMGLGELQMLYTMKVDGINFGTSGSIRYKIEGKFDVPYRDTNSIWVQIDSKWVHFSFLDFYQVGEMKRVVNQLVSYGTTPPMTEKKAFKVNDDPQGSRITAIRPPVGECWGAFIRKFTLSIYSMKELLNKPGIKGWELVADLLYFLAKAQQTCAFTGQQNTGKTTLMKSFVEFCENMNIRILEMSFELAIREIYPWKNVFTVKPTDYDTSSMIQDILKKTDGFLSMVGEVAEDIVAARMIQFCLVGSAFTMFSHHGKDDWGLINGLANSLVASGEYEDHVVAMATVLDAIKHNCHLAFIDHVRVVEYISEIVKEDEVKPYPEISPTDSLAALLYQKLQLDREYYTRVTDRVTFSSRKIIEFNTKTKTYETKNWYTYEMTKDMLNKMSPVDRAAFVTFMRSNWAVFRQGESGQEAA